VDELPRRKALIRGLQILSAAAVIPLAARRAGAAEACVEPASESLRSALHYADPSPNAEQPCMKCGFFTPDKAPCGNCMIMTGPVSEKGHCDSWAAKG